MDKIAIIENINYTPNIHLFDDTQEIRDNLRLWKNEVGSFEPDTPGTDYIEKLLEESKEHYEYMVQVGGLLDNVSMLVAFVNEW